MTEYYNIYNSPLGPIHIVLDQIGVKRIILFEEDWEEYLKENPPHIKLNEEKPKDAITQLDEYFKGQRKDFDLSLSIEGTEFRQKVWKALMEIPYGEIRTYSEIAEKIGNPKAVRAVGQANKDNQIPIIIPCHRVIGKSGNLVGYARDRVYVKEYLLKLEGADLSS